MSPEVAILTTLIVYKVALLAIGLWAQRRTRDGEDFVLAGRRMGPLVAALSASASSSSAWTLLGVSGLAYSTGLSALWVFPACVGGFALNWFLLAGPLRAHAHASGALSVVDVLAGERGRRGWQTIRRIGATLVLLSLLTYVASQFLGAGKNFAETFKAWDVSDESSMILGALIVVAYTLLGGFWAVSLTDTLQGFVMAGTAIALPLACLVELGIDGFVDGIRQVDAPGYASLFGAMELNVSIGFVAGILGIGLGYPGQPHVVNRFMAMRLGERDLRVGRRVAMSWAVIVYAGMIVLGLGARVLFPGVEDEKAFLAAANGLFPPIVAGVMVAAVLSAVMSTTDSQLHVAGTTVSHDLGLGGRDPKRLLWTSRVVIFAISALAIGVILLTENRKIFSLVLFAWSSLGAAFGPLLLVLVLRGPVSARGMIAAMLVGWTLSVGFYFARAPLAEAGLKPWSPSFERILPFGLALVIALMSSRSRGAAPAEETAR